MDIYNAFVRELLNFLNYLGRPRKISKLKPYLRAKPENMASGKCESYSTEISREMAQKSGYN